MTRLFALPASGGRRRPLASFLLAGMAAAALFVGCTSRDGGTAGGDSGDTKRLVILTNVPNPYWDACEAGAKKAAQELKLDEAGYTVVVEQNTKGIQGQIQRLREWAGTPDIAGVGVCLLEPNNTALIDAMKALRDQGVPVITIDSDIDRDNQAFLEARYGYIGTDNVVAGEELGKATAALVPEGGKYATFVGSKTQANAIQRNQGFAQGAGDAFELVDFLSDDGDTSKARQTVRDALVRTPDLKVLVGLWAYNPPAIVDVVREQGIEDRVTVVGFDADPLSLAAMADGRIQALAVQNPYEMGRLGIKALKALIDEDEATLKEVFPNHGQPGGDVRDTGVRIIVPDAESPVMKDRLRPETELLTLEQFNAWLKENNLTGS